jgi:hypothetical protein
MAYGSDYRLTISNIGTTQHERIVHVHEVIKIN